MNATRRLTLEGPARRNRCDCRHCHHVNTYPRPSAGPPRASAVCDRVLQSAAKARHKGRFFKKADAKDIARYRQAERRWKALSPHFVPEQPILAGDETDRLHRWGYEPLSRPLQSPSAPSAFERSARLIDAVKNERVRHALATNFSDLLRYQNMLCRYDTMALKSLDIFSVHGSQSDSCMPNSNLLGIINGGGANVGSGGWTNIIEKYAKAKRYLRRALRGAAPGRTQGPDSDRGRVDRRAHERSAAAQRRHSLRQLATAVDLPPASLDAVFTDPPYFGNVQYGELMDFCYVWLRRLSARSADGFERESCRDRGGADRQSDRGQGPRPFHDGPRRRLRQHGSGPETRGPARLHLPSQQAGGLSGDRRRRFWTPASPVPPRSPARPRWAARSTSTAPARRLSIRFSSAARPVPPPARDFARPRPSSRRWLRTRWTSCARRAHEADAGRRALHRLRPCHPHCGLDPRPTWDAGRPTG